MRMWNTMTLKLDFNRNNFHVISSQTTSKGNQTKYCNGELWFKGDYLGYEGLAETVASRLLQTSNLDSSKYVNYQEATLDLNDGRILHGCVSNNFLAPLESFITFGRLLDKYGIDQNTLDRLPTLFDRISLVVQRLYSITELDLTEYIGNRSEEHTSELQ